MPAVDTVAGKTWLLHVGVKTERATHGDHSASYVMSRKVNTGLPHINRLSRKPTSTKQSSRRAAWNSAGEMAISKHILRSSYLPKMTSKFDVFISRIDRRTKRQSKSQAIPK